MFLASPVKIEPKKHTGNNDIIIDISILALHCSMRLKLHTFVSESLGMKVFMVLLDLDVNEKKQV